MSGISRTILEATSTQTQSPTPRSLFDKAKVSLSLEVPPSGKMFGKRKCPWPDPEQSIGEAYGPTQHAKLSYWEAVGPALEAFTQLLPDIKSELDDKLSPVSGAMITCSVYMIGKSKVEAVPFIMFTCQRKDPRKAALKQIRASKILERFPGMQAGEWQQIPHHGRHIMTAYWDDIYPIIDPDEALDGTTTKDLQAETPWKISIESHSSATNPLQLNFHFASRVARATASLKVSIRGVDYVIVPAHVLVPRLSSLTDSEDDISSAEDETFDFGDLLNGEDEIETEELNTSPVYHMYVSDDETDGSRDLTSPITRYVNLGLLANPESVLQHVGAAVSADYPTNFRPPPYATAALMQQSLDEASHEASSGVADTEQMDTDDLKTEVPVSSLRKDNNDNSEISPLVRDPIRDTLLRQVLDSNITEREDSVPADSSVEDPVAMRLLPFEHVGDWTSLNMHRPSSLSPGSSTYGSTIPTTGGEQSVSTAPSLGTGHKDHHLVRLTFFSLDFALCPVDGITSLRKTDLDSLRDVMARGVFSFSSWVTSRRAISCDTVRTTTQRGLIRGRLHRDSVLARLPCSSEYQSVFLASFDEPIRQGDSGALVMILGKLLGHIVTSNIDNCTVYIVPVTSVRAELERHINTPADEDYGPWIRQQDGKASIPAVGIWDRAGEEVTMFRCSSCGFDYPGWQRSCPQCYKAADKNTQSFKLKVRNIR